MKIFVKESIYTLTELNYDTVIRWTNMVFRIAIINVNINISPRKIVIGINHRILL